MTAERSGAALREKLGRPVVDGDVLPLHWSGETFSYKGLHFSARDVRAMPRPSQNPIPIWIGGNSQLSRRRVAQRAQGWMPLTATAEVGKTAGPKYSPLSANLGPPSPNYARRPPTPVGPPPSTCCTPTMVCTAQRLNETRTGTWQPSQRSRRQGPAGLWSLDGLSTPPKPSDGWKLSARPTSGELVRAAIWAGWHRRGRHRRSRGTRRGYIV